MQNYITDYGGQILFYPTNGLPPAEWAGNYDNAYDEQDDYYDPYVPKDPEPGDDPYVPYEPYDPPDPEPIEYPGIDYFSSSNLTIFFVGYAKGETITAASYPYQRTESGRPLFSYKIVQTATGTDFVIADYTGEFSVSIGEQLTGRFCALLTWTAGVMTIKVWGGGTSDPEMSASKSTRQVSFDSSKIIAGD